MNRKYIEENNIIEQHLLNKLSDEDRKAFRVALLFDESLRQEVEDTRLLHQQIRQLKPQNDIIQPKSKKAKWLIPVLVLTLIITSFFIYKNVGKKDIQTETLLEQSSTNEEKRNDNTELLNNNGEDKEPVIEEKQDDTEPVRSIETEEEPIFDQPIAAADIAPHPYLDQFTRDAVRNNEILVEVNQPRQGQTIELKNGKAKVEVQGKFMTKKEISNKRYTIRLFTNKKADFDAFKPIISVYPTLKKNSTGYEFSTQNIVPFTKGLYYFIIEDTELENMVHVGKFFVK